MLIVQYFSSYLHEKYCIFAPILLTNYSFYILFFYHINGYKKCYHNFYSEHFREISLNLHFFKRSMKYLKRQKNCEYFYVFQGCYLSWSDSRSVFNNITFLSFYAEIIEKAPCPSPLKRFIRQYIDQLDNKHTLICYGEFNKYTFKVKNSCLIHNTNFNPQTNPNLSLKYIFLVIFI